MINMVYFPKRLILESEILRGDIKKVLFYHNASYWYFGDLLKNACWIECLKKENLKIDVCTLEPFLDVFKETKNISKLISIKNFNPNSFIKYDLVIITSAIPITNYNKNIRRAIYASNLDLVYTRWGVVINKFLKKEFNYFTLAEHKHGQTFLPDASNFKATISDKENKDTKKYIDTLLGNSKNIIIFNPTSSNQKTRENDIHEKEVINKLSFENYVFLLGKLAKSFPNYKILIGSSLKKGDVTNIDLIKNLKNKYIKNKNIISIVNNKTLQKGISIRQYMILLNDKRIKFSFGNGTGTNTHLASMLNVPSMSIERGADKTTIDNWKNKNLYQCASFRWRNPQHKVAISVVNNLNNVSVDTLNNIIKHFKYHTYLINKNWKMLLINKKEAQCLSKQILQENNIYTKFKLIKKFKTYLKSKDLIDFYYNFNDEYKYLSLIYPKLKGNLIEYIYLDKPLKSKSNEYLMNSLFKDSNLYKLITLLGNIDIKSNISFKELIFRKMRAGVNLNKNELHYLKYKTNTKLHQCVTDYLHEDIVNLIKKYKINKNTNMKGGWEFKIYNDVNKEFLYKQIFTNSNSIYFSYDWTSDGLKNTYFKSGGLVPFQSQLNHINNKPIVLAKKINPIIIGDKKVNKIICDDEISKTELSIGWIDDLVSLFIKLLKQGVYDADVRLPNVGFDDYGVFQSLDNGSLKDISNSKYYLKNNKMITDIFYLGINQFVMCTKYFSQFKNGDELTNYFIKQIKLQFNIDLNKLYKPYTEWIWGDHNNPKITPFANKLKKIIIKYSKKCNPVPVYPLLNKDLEQKVFDFL